MIEEVNGSVELQMEIKNKIRNIAKELGFAVSGVAEVKEINTILNLKNWVELGCHADMEWFRKSIDTREEIRIWFYESKSVIVFGYPYWHKCCIDQIAMYAHGYDYHKVIKKKIKSIALLLSTIIEKLKFKISVDTGPVHEKEWAVRAGIGWQGKNSLVINPIMGSWFLLGILIVNICLPRDKEIRNQCGDCRKCIESCPTEAINYKGYIDCRKCLAYHTVENKDIIPSNIKDKIKNTIFGCDICQKKCPWNENKILYDNKGFCILGDIDKEKIIEMNDKELAIYFGKTPIGKSRINRFKRNIEIYKKNRE